MNKFLLFCGMCYYPRGGWYDFVGSYDTEKDAINAGKEKILKDGRLGNEAWYQVVSTSELKEVDANAYPNESRGT